MTRGPDWWRWRHLVVALAMNNLKCRYRRSALGIAWTLVHPTLLMGILTVVFGRIFRSDIDHYALYVVSAILLWNFFSQGLVAALWSIQRHTATIRSTAVPVGVFPIATILAAALNLAVASVPLAVAWIAIGSLPGIAWLYPVAAIVGAGLLSTGLALLLIPASLRFTDVHELAGAALTIWMYATPIFYPLDILPGSIRFLVLANPLTMAVEMYRSPLPGVPAVSVDRLLLFVFVSIVSLVVGARVFRSKHGSARAWL